MFIFVEVAFVFIVYEYFFGHPARHLAMIEDKEEGDIENGLVGDTGVNDDTKLREGEEGGAKVDKETPLKSQISGQTEERYMR